MDRTPCDNQTVRHQFDYYCKKILKWEANDYQHHRAWRAEKETSLSNMMVEDDPNLAFVDEYPSDFAHFMVNGIDVAVKNDELAEAIATLSNEKRDVVLLAYFMDMTDAEIAEVMHVVRQTVQYRRVKSLKELRKRMEEGTNGNREEVHQ